MKLNDINIINEKLLEKYNKEKLKVAEEGIEKAAKDRKATKRKIKGPSSKLTPKYKQASNALENMVKKEFEVALKASGKYKDSATLLMKLRNNISLATGVADAIEDNGNDDYLDDVEGWAPSNMAEKYGKEALEKLCGEIFEVAL